MQKNIKEIQSLLGFSSYYRNQIKTFSHITGILYKLCSKNVLFETTKESRNAYNRMEHDLTNAPEFEPPLNSYIDADCTQGLGAALNQRKIVDGEPREGLIFYISSNLKD
ncbi:hypothetical protein O181_127408 [Austropuccinia psidii MF-1]|uniref:Reverse transcriptase/retrotransposon-derived protein RNase H-like domain-containing protein n=1 Tax=Austropuccinia psidii MF-1 TaxID=1389203 RepID=A0A9Q3KUD4_9BASI|nr:hypothetical protein [Austropuccinia psidii MF-1]